MNEVDQLIAERVMRWRWEPNYGVYVREDARSGGPYTTRDIMANEDWSPLSDANADARVLDVVRQWSIGLQIIFSVELCTLWGKRRTPILFPEMLNYQVGDIGMAALAVIQDHSGLLAKMR